MTGLQKFIIRRGWQTLLTFFVVATILFVLFRLYPSDPTKIMLGESLSPEAQRSLTRTYGLDKPLGIQYLLYIKNMATFQLGRSFHTRQPVSAIIKQRALNTVFLMGIGLFFAFTIAFALGTVTAWFRNSRLDKWTVILSLIFRSTPLFLIGIGLVYLFAIRLGVLPTAKMHSAIFTYSGFIEKYFNVDFLRHLVLPVITVVVFYTATPLLIMRGTMLKTLGSDYIMLAQAKGLSENRIMFRHAARNALLPLITTFATTAGLAIGGQVIIETVFAWPGMGTAMVQAVLGSDYPVAQGTFFVMSIFVISLNFIADVAYAYLDPRISYES